MKDSLCVGGDCKQGNHSQSQKATSVENVSGAEAGPNIRCMCSSNLKSCLLGGRAMLDPWVWIRRSMASRCIT